ncbi:TMEM175 family protein [Flavobacterium capsici]|uniref:TMEM175 family protein n=1 Tax=Flavobacterium capsici TaxID=3075618 RepID=A0AA96EYU6_9FLAO|nr:MULTISPECIES: TMEM175 family protein [unclassified Flavobacterium]WNM17960.1 TMEM175 family protein [Flavobacterium sp. PMR2A8]WNM22012.1 TMEM175 family protein [Flavobacterium sp. PMTSA4]
MNKTRLEAFSDGVLAIIITIMVLEIKVPHGNELSNLKPLIPIFLSYLLSFIYLGIYWNNHHHMMHTLKNINGGILWANLHLLFWLSLIPFATAWNGENHFAPTTMMIYGVVLFMNGIAYFILQNLIIKSQGDNSLLKKAIGKDYKGKSSPILYLIAIIFANSIPIIAGIIYIFVALMWLVPDKRIERIINHQ